MRIACCQPSPSRLLTSRTNPPTTDLRRHRCLPPRCQSSDDYTAFVTPRRHLLLAPALLAAGVVLRPSDSSAVGIPDVLSQGLKKQLEPYLSAPAEFLKTRQRANGGEILLAPIRASRQVLEVSSSVKYTNVHHGSWTMLDRESDGMQAAEASLQELNIYEPDPAIYSAILSKVRRASLDCYVHEAADNDTIETRATQATQKWIRIADPCTFRLIAKNVTGLLPREQKDLKVKTYKQLNELIQSFQLLDDIVDMAQDGDGTARERLPGCLQFTMAHITSFENCILTSLGFEPVLAT
ncbi:hypothetical protein ABBQ38_000946 [Trebouxia sp. C0009 RCD-2024]